MQIYCGLCDEYNELPTKLVAKDGKVNIECPICEIYQEIHVVEDSK